MKKKITAILLTIALLAGCEAAPATIPDIETIVQQSVDAAVAQYEELQREKNAEIAELKAQLEELTSQTEEASDDTEPTETTTPAEETPAPASSQPEEQETQPGPEPE